jgi:hypothetical protein
MKNYAHLSSKTEQSICNGIITNFFQRLTGIISIRFELFMHK